MMLEEEMSVYIGLHCCICRYTGSDNYMYQSPNGYGYGESSLSPTGSSNVYSPTASPTTPQPVTIVRTVDLLDTGM